LTLATTPRQMRVQKLSNVSRRVSVRPAAARLTPSRPMPRPAPRPATAARTETRRETFESFWTRIWRGVVASVKPVFGE